MWLIGAFALGAANFGPDGTAYTVTSRVDPAPILAYRGFGVGNSDWMQASNPTSSPSH